MCVMGGGQLPGSLYPASSCTLYPAFSCSQYPTFLVRGRFTNADACHEHACMHHAFRLSIPLPATSCCILPTDVSCYQLLCPATSCCVLLPAAVSYQLMCPATSCCVLLPTAVSCYTEDVTARVWVVSMLRHVCG